VRRVEETITEAANEAGLLFDVHRPDMSLSVAITGEGL
jgi:hypothetical protein